MNSRGTCNRGEILLAALVTIVSTAVPFWILRSSGHHGQGGFPLDDAWIHLVYGRSVAQSGYLAYNAGVPSTGCTSPLWAYVLGLLHAVLHGPGAVIWGVKILGMALHGAMSLLCFRLVRRMASSVWPGFATAVFLGACPALAATSLSGMEVTIGCLLCLAGMCLYLEERPVASGVLLGLAGLARPEFGAVILVLAGDLLLGVLRKKSSGLVVLKFAGPIALLACLFVGWNLAVDGRPFPATFYAKAAPAGGDWIKRLGTGLGIITDTAPLHAGVLTLGLLGLVLAKGAGRRYSVLFFLSGGLYFAANLAVILPFHPKAFYHIRYLLPAVPLLFIGSAAGMVQGGNAVLGFARERAARFRPIALPVLFSIIGGIVILLSVWTVSGWRFWVTKYSRDCRNINEVQVALGKAVGRGMKPDARLGTIDAGAIRYFGERFTMDLMGLNTPLFSDADCRGPVLDALVLMPAWVRLPSLHHLVPVLARETYDYQVTSNPAMGRQLITVCQSDSAGGKEGFGFRILGRNQSVCLTCLSPSEVDGLRRSLAPE